LAIRIILVDDHAGVRRGIRHLLEDETDIEVVGEADNGADALRLAAELAPDVVVLDMEMPGMRGIQVARRLRAEGSPVKVLALSAYDDTQYIEGMRASGAAGYLLKEEAPHLLAEALRAVTQGGEGWFSRRAEPRTAASQAAEPQEGNAGINSQLAAGTT
jgi:DNA-binding NarL/FixJ family response regulator